MSARGKTPTQRGTKPPERPSSKGDLFDDAPTQHYDGKLPKGPAVAEAPAAAKPLQKIVTISMKTPASPKLAPVEVPEHEKPHIKLRALSEVSRAQIPLDLGNLAPPYDPDEARKRTLKEYLLWGSIAVILACVIALAVWFAAT
jgi:hypothetical protein